MDTGNNWNQNNNNQNNGWNQNSNNQNNGWNQNSNNQNNGWNQNCNNQNNGWNQNCNNQNNGWNQNCNNQNNNNQYGGYNQYPLPGAGFINASYIMGILAIVTTIMCTVYLPYIFGGLSIVFALLSRGNARKVAGKAAAGMKCAIIGLIMNTALIVTCFTMMFTNPEIHDQVNKLTKQLYGQTFDEMMQDIENGETPDITDGSTGTYN